MARELTKFMADLPTFGTSCRAEKEAGYELKTGNDGPDQVLVPNAKGQKALHSTLFSKLRRRCIALTALQYQRFALIELASKEVSVSERTEIILRRQIMAPLTLPERRLRHMVLFLTDKDIEAMADTPKLTRTYLTLMSAALQMALYLIEQLQFTGSSHSTLSTEAVFLMRPILITNEGTLLDH